MRVTLVTLQRKSKSLSNHIRKDLKEIFVIGTQVLLLTLDLHYGVSLDDAELGGSDTGVVTGVPDVAELQDVLSNGKLVVGREVPGALPPLYEGHGAANSHAGDVDVRSVLHLVLCLRSDGEVRRNSPH